MALVVIVEPPGDLPDQRYELAAASSRRLVYSLPEWSRPLVVSFMKLLAGLVGVMMVGSSASAETIRFALTRNGDQIGTHVIEINRSGSETSVKTTIDLAVRVFVITVYRLKHTATERWANARLVSLNSNTDDNGTPRSVAVIQTPSGLEITADGKTTHADHSLVPLTLWNTELLTRKVALNAQDGEIMPLSVDDHGSEQLIINGRVLKAKRYTLKTKHTQDVWYDEQARPVRASITAPDGSVVISE